MWGLPAYFCQRVLGNCSISWKRAAGSPSNAAQCRGVRPTGLRSGSFMSFSSLLSLSRAVLQFLRPPLAVVDPVPRRSAEKASRFAKCLF